MHKPPYNLWLLLLLAFPIVYDVWFTMAPSYPTWANVWILYFAIFLSGPLLLLYALAMRVFAEEKVLSTIAFIGGGAWIAVEIFQFVRAD